VGLFAAYLALGVLANVFPLQAQAHLGLSKPTVGGLMLVRALLTTLALGFLGRTTAWHFRAGQIGIGLVVFAVAMAGLPLAGGPVAAGAVLGLMGALVAQSYANSLFHGVTGSQQRARRMATHEMLLSIGLVVGGACGGVVYQTAGYGAICGGAAAVLGAAAVTAFGFARRPDRKGL
jgi:DHA1 family multidrug resistance protein-like MFS transporter/DHA1 family quinolone resistance protein-like MFS transporter